MAQFKFISTVEDFILNYEEGIQLPSEVSLELKLQNGVAREYPSTQGEVQYLISNDILGVFAYLPKDVLAGLTFRNVNGRYFTVVHPLTPVSVKDLASAPVADSLPF